MTTLPMTGCRARHDYVSVAFLVTGAGPLIRRIVEKKDDAMS